MISTVFLCNKLEISYTYYRFTMTIFLIRIYEYDSIVFLEFKVKTKNQRL